MIHVSIYIVFREHVARSATFAVLQRHIQSGQAYRIVKEACFVGNFFRMRTLKFSKFQRHFPDPNTSRQRLKLVTIR